jgi:hypothetical protein
VVPFTFRTTETIASLSTESLDAVRVLAYALVKEYARPYETLRERAAVCDFLPRALPVIAMEKPSKVVCSRSHTTLEEAMEGVKWCFFQTESLVLGLVFGLLEIVLSDTQQSRGLIEDIERAKGDSFDTRIST